MTSKGEFVGPLYIEDANLSFAWGQVVAHIFDHKGREVSPLIVSITGFDENGTVHEDEGIRKALDDLLAKKGQQSVEKVAFTIFPERYWIMAQGDRTKLFSSYMRAFPRFQKMEPRKNAHGLYFERLINFPGAPNEGNQLETILSKYNGRGGKIQRMQLQASTFDPARDHSESAIHGFPCLQHVTFAPSSEGLVVNAFYATQQLFVRAYGNFLGLSRLGAFMANEMGLEMARLNVMVGIEKLEGVAKTCDEVGRIVEMINQRKVEGS